MKLKVLRGTTAHDTRPLCESCSHSRIIKGERLDDHITYCCYINDRIVPFKVLECNAWEEKNKVGMHEMAKMAWVITGDKKGGKPGFMSPNERKAAGVKVGNLTHGDTTYHVRDDND